MPDEVAGDKVRPRQSAFTVQHATRELTRRFLSAGLPTAELDARLLVSHACRLSRETYIVEMQRPVAPTEHGTIEAFAERRMASEPVARIIGKREFYGRDFFVSPAVLDPRPDTEALIDAILEWVSEDSRSLEQLRILDLGTGSGCILLSLLAELPESWGVGVDIRENALEIARKNAKSLALTGRSAFVCMDWMTAMSADFDLIVSNPPYIATGEIAALGDDVRLYDPAIALDGGTDGFAAYRRIAEAAKLALRPGGLFAVEAGVRQAEEIVNVFREAELMVDGTEARIYPDLIGINRVVAIKRQAAE